MVMEITNNYDSVYEGVYAAQKKQTKNTDTETSSRDYLKQLEKLAPSVEFRMGYGHASDKTGKTLTINPKLLEKMQNDPEKAKEMRELIRGVEMMTKLSESINKATGWKTVYRHSYIDENGKYSHVAVTRNEAGYKMSEKLRQERWENAEKFVKRMREKAAERKEELQEMLEEKRSEKADKADANGQDDVGANVDMEI